MRHLFATLCSVLAFCLLISPLAGVAQENPDSLGLGFSITNDEAGNLVWGVNGDRGEKLDLPADEVQRRLENEIFPETLKKAEAGEAPAVWAIGFFYLDDMVTDKDLGKAETAFRTGLAHDAPIGLLTLGYHYFDKGSNERNNPELQETHFGKSEALCYEILEAKYEDGASLATQLASVYMFEWYGAEKDLTRAEEILKAADEIVPDNPAILLLQAKLSLYLKDYLAAYELASRAEEKLLELPDPGGFVADELKKAKASKISAAVLSGEISKIDPEEFLEMSKDSLGLNGPFAWSVPILLVLVLAYLIRRSRRSWDSSDDPSGPRIWLSLMWISVAILAAGIGFNIRLPGLDNGVGHWIGAIIVTLFSLYAVKIGGWKRYFGTRPLFTGAKNFFKGLGIVVVCVVGTQLIALGYAKVYELVLNQPLDQQLVSLFIKSENLIELAGTVLIVGIAIPFYEEVFFRGFFYDALDRRWGMKTALIVSSVFFALVHGLTFFVPLLFLSLALGWLRQKTGDLRMSFILHAANNSTSVLTGYFLSSPT